MHDQISCQKAAYTTLGKNAVDGLYFTTIKFEVRRDHDLY